MRFTVLLLLMALVQVGCQTSRPGQDVSAGTGGIKQLRSAADRGDAEAQYALGVAYYQGTQLVQDNAAAVSWFRKAADQGKADAQFDLGLMYGYGLGVGRDLQASELWLSRAAAQGHSKAGKWLPLAINGTIGTAQPEATGSAPRMGIPAGEETTASGSGRSEAVVRAAATAGDVDAVFELGTMYSQGLGVKRDYKVAWDWFSKGAEQGDARCQDQLGVLYATARGVEQDDALAMQWFQKSAAQNHASACSHLGLMYMRGRGTPKDDKLAAEFFLKAAELGMASAQFRLGQLIEQGHGVEQNYPKAYGWYRKAAEQADPQGQDRLAWLMATCSVDGLRDGPSAIHYAILANTQSQWQNSIHLETLAAAYAEAGQFDEAIRRQQQVVDQLNRALGGGAGAERMGRLELYKLKLPYRSR